jgi:hypothetical protein
MRIEVKFGEVWANNFGVNNCAWMDVLLGRFETRINTMREQTDRLQYWDFNLIKLMFFTWRLLTTKSEILALQLMSRRPCLIKGT